MPYLYNVNIPELLNITAGHLNFSIKIYNILALHLLEFNIGSIIIIGCYYGFTPKALKTYLSKA